MKRVALSVVITSALVYSIQAMGYKEPTHVRLSEQAAKASVLYKPETGAISNLGLKPIENDSQKFLNSENKDRTILQLIQDGSDFEDNNIRSINHFFDPLYDDGLLFTSPTWSLEDKGSIVLPLWQRYSFADARDYFHKALTLPDKTERDKNFGLTFESLGRVIHHIQDMAQPQHTRADTHLPVLNTSLYEKFTNDNRGMGFFTQHLVPGAYPPVTFPKARDFWHTQDKNPAAGQGIAEFTNTNFVSAGTNFTGTAANISPNPNYPSPNGTGAVVSPRQITDTDLLGPNQPLTGEIDFIGIPVTDNYPGGSSGFNDRTSSYSLFDADLTVIGAEKTFTLNRFNFQAAYPFLIPRAVGYSAGLIDYFFRGKLEITLPDEAVYGIVDHSTVNQKDTQGFTRIKLTLKNAVTRGHA